MVCELVFLEVGVGYGIEGGKQGGAGVYGSVFDRVPDLYAISLVRCLDL